MSEHNSPLEYEQIPELIWDCLRTDPDFSSVHFQNIGPYDKVELPAVVWRGLGFKPGNTFAPNGRRESTKPRKVWESPSLDGKYLIETYAQKHTGEFQFEIIDASSKSAYTLMNRFQSAIFHSLPSIKRGGVNEIIFTGMSPEWTFERKATQLYVKPCKYTVIWDRRIEVAIERISEINTQALSLLRSIDVPIVRSDQSFDIIAQPIAQMDYAFDYPYLSQEAVTTCEVPPDEWSPYIHNIDFTFRVEEGVTKVEWLANRHIPQPGQTYYLTYWYQSP